MTWLYFFDTYPKRENCLKSFKIVFLLNLYDFQTKEKTFQNKLEYKIQRFCEDNYILVRSVKTFLESVKLTIAPTKTIIHKISFKILDRSTGSTISCIG